MMVLYACILLVSYFAVVLYIALQKIVLNIIIKCLFCEKINDKTNLDF